MQDALGDVSAAVSDFHFPNSLPWSDTKIITFQLLHLEYTQAMMIELGDHYNPTIHIPEAIGNCTGEYTTDKITSVGNHVYYTDAMMHAKWKQCINNSIL